ncbi:hypothetical protein CAPTEDRAFT_124535, partial [Capitella teleta]
ACEAGWTEFNRRCYKYFNSNLTFYNAKRSCIDNHATLVKVDTQETNNAVLAIVPVNSYYFWIGLSRDNTEAEWQWADGTLLSQSNWTNWKRGEPRSDSNCVWRSALTDTSEPGCWTGYSCNTYICYVCEKGK